MRLVIKNLMAGSSHHLQFRSKNESDVSEWSRSFRVDIGTSVPLPLAPTGVTLESIGDSFHAKWNRVTKAEDGSDASDLIGYVVQFRKVDGAQTGTFETVSTDFELTFNLNFAVFTPPAGQIGVRIAAKNSMGNQGEWSEEVITQNPPPGPVRNLTAIGMIGSIVAQWEPPEDLEDDFKEYRAYVGTDPDFEMTAPRRFWTGVGTTAPWHSDDETRDWYIKVVAVDKFESESLPVTAGPVRPRSSTKTDVEAPDTPADLSAVIQGNEAVVSWTPPANPDNDLAGYQIGYRPTGSPNWSYANASHEDSSVAIAPITQFSNYDFKIRSHDFSFNYSGWSTIATADGEVSTAPAVPTGLRVRGAITTAMVVWDANTEQNLAGYEVQFEDHTPLDTDEIYASTGRVISFSENVSEDTTYHARVRAVNAQGLKSNWSAVATGTVGVVNTDEIDGIIGGWVAGTGTTLIHGGIIQTDTIGALQIRTEEIAADEAFLNNLIVNTGHISDLTFDKIEGGEGIIDDLSVKSILTIGDSLNTGAIQSHNYNAGIGGGGFGTGTSGAGYRLDNNGITIHDGSISASALRIQTGQNIMPGPLADFEFPSEYYDNSVLTPSSCVALITNGGRFNQQYLSVVGTTTGVFTLALAGSLTDYNIPVEGGKQYIVSLYISGTRTPTSFQARVRYSTGGYSVYTPLQTIPATSGFSWERFSMTVDVPSSATAMLVQLRTGTAGPGQGWNIDGVQVEEKISGSDDPSAWSPPSTTTIDGSMIRTGEIRSNVNILVNGVQQPAWSINMHGGMQIGSAHIRGTLTVGGSTSESQSVIQSANYIAGSSGFMLRGSDGYADLQNVNINMIGTASKLIAGVSATGERTEISNIGLRYYGSDPDYNDPISEFGHDLRIVDVSNEDVESRGSIYGINNVGDMNVAKASINEDPQIAGTPLLGTLALRPDEVNMDTELGHMDKLTFAGNHGERNFNPSGWIWNTHGVEKTALEVEREQQGGRALLVIVSGKVRFADQANNHRMTLRVRKTEANLTPPGLVVPQPTTSSPLFHPDAERVMSFGGGHAVFTQIMGVHRPSRSETARWLLTVESTGMVQTGWRIEDAAITFIDIGTRDDVLLDTVNRVVADGASPPPPANPKRTFTSRWYSTSLRRAQGSNVTSSGDRSGQALQGWTGGMSGDAFHSIVGFTGGAHYGETGKTITQALGNATVDRVRIRINQAGGYGGVQPRLGIQTSSVAIPVMNQYLAAMSPGQTTYHILHAPFRTGLKSGQRYITFGPSPKSHAQYAAYHGSSGGNSRRLELEITYTR